MTFFFIGYNNVQIGSGSVINWPLGSGSLIQQYGFARLEYLRIHNTSFDSELVLVLKFGLDLFSHTQLSKMMIWLALNILVRSASYIL
jgi:hypothetical protein